MNDYRVRQSIIWYVEKTEEYSEDSKARGIELGLGIDGEHNGDLDAFRHAYVSARVVQEFGGAAAEAGGHFHEAGNHVRDIFVKGNEATLAETIMDEHNNRVGREIGMQAAREGWSRERLAQEIKTALDDGRLIRRPDDAGNADIFQLLPGSADPDGG